MSSAQYGSLPFQEQIDFFRQKVNLPTASWTDLWDGQHARSFVVAGATKDDLLVDLRGAVDKAISTGSTLDTFRKDFDQIVAKHGWSYNGGRNWRTRVIYETNLNSSYMTGRYAQLQKLTRTRPYWRYVHSPFVSDPRPEHKAWDGRVLRHDDPFWKTHWPPNGWGCQCRVDSLSDRDLKRMGKTGPDEAPPIEMEERTVGIRGPNPRTVKVPKGIDPGFGYSVGEAAYGQQLADDTMAAWRTQGAAAWQNLTPQTWVDRGRPPGIPLDPPVAQIVAPVESKEAMVDQLKTILGGDEKVFDVKGLPVAVNAESLAAHLDDLGRSRFLPLLPEALADPFEVWTSFERHKGTGLVVLRTRVIKAVALDKGRALLVVANVVRGRLEAWTFIPTENVGYLQASRRGELLWGR